MKNYAVAVIGTGRIGKVHIETLQRLRQVHLKGVSDPYVDPVWAKQLGIEQIETDHMALLTNPEIDAVFICSPSSFHAQQIVEAARAGKHIFCEKPIALEPDVIRNCLAEVEKHGVKLQIGFNRRFDPNFRRVRDVVASGQIGVPHLLQITSRDPSPPTLDYVKNSGGLFLDMTIHDFDMARFLIGSEVTEVYATGSALINPEIQRYQDVDTAVITLTFENGTIGVINNSRQAVYGYDQRVEVLGPKGNIAAENKTPTQTILSTQTGVIHDNPLNFFLERYQEAYLAEAEAFFEYLETGGPSPASGKDGLKPVLIGLAAGQSLRENRPVSISY